MDIIEQANFCLGDDYESLNESKGGSFKVDKDINVEIFKKGKPKSEYITLKKGTILDVVEFKTFSSEVGIELKNGDNIVIMKKDKKNLKKIK